MDQRYSSKLVKRGKLHTENKRRSFDDIRNHNDRAKSARYDFLSGNRPTLTA